MYRTNRGLGKIEGYPGMSARLDLDELHEASSFKVRQEPEVPDLLHAGALV